MVCVVFARFEEAYGFERLLDVGDFVAETGGAALGVLLHELVLSEGCVGSSINRYCKHRQSLRDHLFEAVDGAFHLGSVGDVVLDALGSVSQRPRGKKLCSYIDEGSSRYASRIGRRIAAAVHLLAWWVG